MTYIILKKRSKLMRIVQIECNPLATLFSKTTSVTYINGFSNLRRSERWLKVTDNGNRDLLQLEVLETCIWKHK